MARYVDGFVLPIPKKNAAAYQRIAMASGAVMPFDGKRVIFGGFEVRVDL
jgi:uncharacterized protein YbaA (DUF1428 family)